MKGLITAALAAFVLSSAAAGARADEAASQAALARMLEVGWGTNTSFRAAGSKEAEALFAAEGRSPRVLDAVALMYIKQGRYADAQKLIDELLGRESSNLAAQRARVWLATILKKYDAAMVAAEKLAEAVSAADTAREGETQRELIGFLGRIYGFLGGPAGKSVDFDRRKASERKILAGLSTERRTLFEEARDAVLQKHLELIDAKDATTDAAREATEDAKAKTLDEIASEREERGARLKELQDRRDKLQKELRDELAEIAKEDRPLVTELAGLERRAAVLNRDLAGIQVQVGSVQALLEREENPGQRQLLLGELDRLVIIGSRLESDLVAVNRLAAGVQAQRQVLAARQRKAQFDVGGQVKRINDEAAEMARREKRASAIEKRTERTSASTPAAALALRATAGALATYDPFPLEEEKVRILAERK